MKRIIKALAPEDFVEWKRTDRMAHRPRWKRVPTPIKNEVHRSLMREQGFICCYCEARVAEDDSHVEHFRPKETHSAEQLNYENLHCSCQRELSRGEPRHCGVRKGRWFDERLLVSPLSSDCENRFRFTADGQILPRRDDDAGAKATIRKLCLDLPKLRALRAAAVDALYESSANEIRRCLARDPEGRFSPFHSTIRHVLST